MGKHRWEQHEKQYLIDNYCLDGAHRCAEYLGLPKNAVVKMAGRLGISRGRRNFTPDEIDYIKTNYEKHGPLRISKKLSVKQGAVRSVAKRFGLIMGMSERGKITALRNIGRHVSKHTREKIGSANRKHWSKNKCLECGAIIRRRSKRCQPCELKRRSGENHNWWNGGVTPLYSIVKSRLYYAWKFPVMRRDNFTCQDCGKNKCELEVHHIRFFTEIRDSVIEAHPQLDMEANKHEIAELIVEGHKMEDGITLCRPCHEKRHWNNGVNCLERPNANGEDNQQPSRSNVIKIVDRKVQRSTGEEITTNKPDTSAPHVNAKT